ncbi:MAG: cyclic nucleotide-binding domain-containing protein [Actinobacteria bacterium]|nr:cyclic nucleotide-binding domain-containing protein [Actinomycetota bacterium]MCL6094359.1 cyclic nucleotide-binding domain-containing protein [Actinomycetota bacterium]
MRDLPMDVLISRHPLLAGLPNDILLLLAGCARNVPFHAGTLLLSEGDTADTFYLIRRGRVGIEVHDPRRGRVVVETVGPGSVVGWSWLFPPYRWHFDARAIDEVGTIALDGACLRTKAEADPVVGYELMKRLSNVLLERLQATRVRLLDLYGDGKVS